MNNKGPFNYYVRIQGWVGIAESGNFPLNRLCTENVLTYLGTGRTVMVFGIYCMDFVRSHFGKMQL